MRVTFKDGGFKLQKIEASGFEIISGTIFLQNCNSLKLQSSKDRGFRLQKYFRHNFSPKLQQLEYLRVQVLMRVTFKDGGFKLQKIEVSGFKRISGTIFLQNCNSLNIQMSEYQREPLWIHHPAKSWNIIISSTTERVKKHDFYGHQIRDSLLGNHPMRNDARARDDKRDGSGNDGAGLTRNSWYGRERPRVSDGHSKANPRNYRNPDLHVGPVRSQNNVQTTTMI